MAVVLKKSFPSNGDLLIFEIEEFDVNFYLDKLSLPDTAFKEYQNISLDKRKIEWLASRYALYHLIGRESFKLFDKDEHGKPYLKSNDFHLSISHSAKYIAVSRCDNPTGVDIQKITPKILNLASKFLSSNENLSIPEEEKVEILHVYWGAKECMYKGYGRKNLSFKDQLIIKSFQYNTKGSRFREN